MSFCNISKHDSDKIKGYQVRATVNGKEVQPFFGGLSNESLKEALKERNKIWKKNGIIARNVLMSPLKGTVKSKASSSGWHGIYDKTEVERSGAACDVYAVHLRNLATGKPTNRAFRKHLYKTPEAALREAKSLRKRNIEAFNSMVEEYNASIYKDAVKLADKEVRQLKPFLNDVIGFDKNRWDKVFKKHFPTGLESNIDPKIVVKAKKARK
ncbi:MAG: hypothetical protein JKY01_05390 [Pseudomonadales bacterium]|nr:hypothetical protein [Pseudomonadales bacterium]